MLRPLLLVVAPVALAIAGLLILLRYQIAPGGLLTWRMDRWTGEVCQVAFDRIDGAVLRCKSTPTPTSTDSIEDLMDAMRKLGIEIETPTPTHRRDLFDELSERRTPTP